MLRYFQQRYNGVKQSGELGGVLLNSQGWIRSLRIQLSIFHFQSVIEKHLIAMHKKDDNAPEAAQPLRYGSEGTET